ncbi:MAG: metallophosphoesterase, partial [Oscillospiraceae bacterium]|nr:metallophosphoesterase [Oscillospiraceae bacterium]
MIYLISDLHGELNFKGLLQYVDIAKEDDLLIILGDVCMKFEDTEENRKFTEYILSIKKNIAIVDGNHENFEYLKSFPEEDWNGGRVHRLSESIVHLMRGNVFEICGKRFFVFGGCKSSSRWREMGLWHPGDEPEKEEIELAYENIKKHDFCFDYILTHKYEQTPPKGTLCESLQALTQYIEDKVSYKYWYSGHWHANKKTDEKHI